MFYYIIINIFPIAFSQNLFLVTLYIRNLKIDSSKHLVLTAVHPSPRSAEHGFFGCRHFSKANDYLRSKGIGEIDW